MATLQDMTDEQLLELADFPPAITEEQMQQMELKAEKAAVTRRVILAMLTRDGQTMKRLRLETPELFLELAHCLKGFRIHTEAVLETIEIAMMRMTVGDCWGEQRLLDGIFEDGEEEPIKLH